MKTNEKITNIKSGFFAAELKDGTIIYATGYKILKDRDYPRSFEFYNWVSIRNGQHDKGSKYCIDYDEVLPIRDIKNLSELIGAIMLYDQELMESIGLY